MDSLKENPIRSYNPEFSSLKSIGNLMYGTYGNEIVLTGIILLISVIGSVIMTIKYVKIVPKRIFVSDQVKRNKKDCIEMVNPVIGSGVSY